MTTCAASWRLNPEGPTHHCALERGHAGRVHLSEVDGTAHDMSHVRGALTVYDGPLPKDSIWPDATWANGYGIWHARVPRHAAGPLLAARRLIRDELLARETNIDPRVYMDLERVPAYDTADTIVYREGQTWT